MKKIMVLSFIFVTLGISFYLNCNKMAFNGNLSDLQIANIEALAGRESGVSNTGPAEEKNVMVGDIKWYAVVLILNHVLGLIVIDGIQIKLR